MLRLFDESANFTPCPVVNYYGRYSQDSHFIRNVPVLIKIYNLDVQGSVVRCTENFGQIR